MGSGPGVEQTKSPSTVFYTICEFCPTLPLHLSRISGQKLHWEYYIDRVPIFAAPPQSTPKSLQEFLFLLPSIVLRGTLNIERTPAFKVTPPCRPRSLDTNRIDFHHHLSRERGVHQMQRTDEITDEILMRQATVTIQALHQKLPSASPYLVHKKCYRRQLIPVLLALQIRPKTHTGKQFTKYTN